ncbi:MAG: PEGA domain-containing protein [Candidatus Wildermuthbacteria bacterium]|nr:PEGA domain-containing protein [Candidatus Wildermuthbacteria bacterium]
MTKRQRGVLFTTLTILFLLLAPTIILYSQGYRFDWETKKLFQTGGLYIKATPSRADISVDGILTGKTDALFGSALLGDLLPKTYRIRIEKEGYTSWEKTLEIKETLVTEAEHIILFPRRTGFSPVATNISDAWLAPDEHSLLLWKNNSAVFFDPETKEEFLLCKEPVCASQGLLPPAPSQSLELEQVFEGAANFALSPDGATLAFSKTNQLWVYRVDEERESLLLHAQSTVRNIQWLTNYYLVWNTEKEIVATEIDTRDHANSALLATFENPEFLWHSQTKTLSVLSKNTFYLSEKFF